MSLVEFKEACSDKYLNKIEGRNIAMSLRTTANMYQINIYVYVYGIYIFSSDSSLEQTILGVNLLVIQVLICLEDDV